ncbi:MAG: TIGR04053 family radical SAM/SPASM domain-containing protein [Phycisphaerae bacterium]|nr:TIGR04053 family radical SAM/SPASM domain-containing protein [Phycisphaerae bacterium]
MRQDGFDFNERPFVVVWEMTQACDLACKHCRASAQPLRHADELDTREAERLIDQIADMEAGVLVLSGGDPMKREDVFHLVRYGHERGVRMAMTPSVTPLLTDDAIHRLAREGLSQFAVSLDGSCARIHDEFRGFEGAYARTMEVIRVAREAGLPVQINTTVCRSNLADLPAMADLLARLDIVLWSVFFLVPVGRGQAEQRIAPEEYEQVFELLWSLRQRVPFKIKSTEAPHYRRFVLQKLKAARARGEGSGFGVQGSGEEDKETRGQGDKGIQDLGGGGTEGRRNSTSGPGPGYESINLNDGRGFVFISHTGEVFPSGFLAVSVGNVRTTSLAELYRNTPLMRDLRNSNLLGGKCGICEFRNVCGGSRARSWALTGDPLAPEPDCTYQPH